MTVSTSQTSLSEEELVEKAREALDLDWVTAHTPPGAVVRYAEGRAADLLSRLEAAEGERARQKELLEWIAEYGTRQGDLKEGHAEAMRNIARAALSTGDRQDDDSHVRTAEATQPAQARHETRGGST